MSDSVILTKRAHFAPSRAGRCHLPHGDVLQRDAGTNVCQSLTCIFRMGNTISSVLFGVIRRLPFFWNFVKILSQFLLLDEIHRRKAPKVCAAESANTSILPVHKDHHRICSFKLPNHDHPIPKQTHEDPATITPVMPVPGNLFLRLRLYRS